MDYRVARQAQPETGTFTDPHSPQTVLLTANPHLCSVDDAYAAAKGYEEMRMMRLERESGRIARGCAYL